VLIILGFFLMETGKDRILKAINHVQPEITPISLGGVYNLQAFLEHFGIENEAMLRERLDLDLCSVRPVYTGPHAQKGLDSFGAPVDDIYGADGVGYGVGRAYPLAEATTVEEVERFAWPDPADFNYEIAASLLQNIPDDKAKRIDGKYGIARPGKSLEEAAGGGPWLPLICNLFNLFGLEKTLLNFACQQRLIETAVKKTEEFTLEFFRRLCEATRGLADLAYYGDDFATQRGLLISPEDWRRFLKPTYKRVFELLKGYGLGVWFHSCGQFRPVLGDLADIGMDVWETVQSHLPGNEPEVLKREYGDRITFYGAISTQKTLPFGSEEDVRREVRDRIRVLGKRGGYIVGPDHGIMPDVPVKNVLAMFDEARRFRFENKDKPLEG
jgi:uroporphyrinogen decarboxylase